MTVRRPVAGRRRAALLAACLAVGFAVAGCSSSNTSAPSMADVRALLARHGTAVLHHDRQAFADDLATSEHAALFRSAQLSAYTNLVKLPLRVWSYRIEARTQFRTAETAASRRYGGQAIIVQVALRYALRGVDRIPTSHDLWWTFVRQHGRVVIAADNGLENAGGVSWLGPWDFGPLTVLRGAHSLVLGHPDHADALPQVEANVEAAVPVVTSVWGSEWSQDVAVVVPSSDQELLAQAGQSSDVSTQIAAVAISDGTDPISGTVLGQRLIVNPAALARLSALGQRITIQHEITHIASAAETTGASPQWLVEGFADYVGNLGNRQPVTTIASELHADVARGHVPTALPSANQFATDGQAAQAYEGSWLACRLIAQSVGQSGLVRFYRLVGASPFNTDAAVDRALRKELHESTAQFTMRWRNYVEAQLG
jgi:hypothetical protein